MSEYFPQPNSLGTNIIVSLCNRNRFKTDLANLKSDVDKLDINKSKNLPTKFEK